VGVIHLPESSLGKTLFAVKRGGAYKMENGEDIEETVRIETSEHESIEDSLFFLTTSDMYEGEYELEEKVFAELVDRNAVHRQLGSAAIELAFLASGQVECFINPISKKWDYSAGKVIVEEAGGEVRTRESRFPDSYEVIASNGKIQDNVEPVVGETFQ